MVTIFHLTVTIHAMYGINHGDRQRYCLHLDADNDAAVPDTNGIVTTYRERPTNKDRGVPCASTYSPRLRMLTGPMLSRPFAALSAIGGSAAVYASSKIST